MLDFDSKYEQIHRELQENSDLVNNLSDTAKGYNPWKDQSKQIDYHKTNLKHNGIFIGLDLNIGHLLMFEEIVAKMRLVYEMLDGEADIPRIYALLEPSECHYKSKRLAIISEDMSCGGKYEIIDSTNRPLEQANLLLNLFSSDSDIGHIKFHIYDPKKIKDTFPPHEGRFPFVDFDHVEIRSKYQDRYQKYIQQYISDERFRIAPM